MKEHYLDWLRAERPELVALHEERFKRRSYQPDVEAARVGALVAAVGRHPASTGRRAIERPDGRVADKPDRTNPAEHGRQQPATPTPVSILGSWRSVLALDTANSPR